MPTKGNRFAVGGEVGSPPGSIAYYKLSYQQQHFVPLTPKNKLIAMANINLGYGQGLVTKFIRSTKTTTEVVLALCVVTSRVR